MRRSGIGGLALAVACSAVLCASSSEAQMPPDGMVAVKGGCFMMGQDDLEKDWLIKTVGREKYDKYLFDERPLHEVCVDGFYMSAREVTVSEFKAFVEDTGYRTEAERSGGCIRYFEESFWKKAGWRPDDSITWRSPGFTQTGSHPVVCVSWNDAAAYAQWKAKKTGLGHRLPTEAEWEYAARSRGKNYRYSWGEGPPSANVGDKAAKRQFPGWQVWDGYDDGYVFTSPAGSFKPNELGLFDMTGNVWEWCSDRWDTGYYARSPKNNPAGPETGEYRIARGGAWNDPARVARISRRGNDKQSDRLVNSGFRLVAPISVSPRR